MKIISLETTPFYQLESLNRGVWTFTSFLSDSKEFIFLNDHLDRLILGADYLFPKHKWKESKALMLEFLEKEFVSSHYFRMSIVDDTLLFSKRPHVPKPPYVNLANATSKKAPTLIPSFVKNPNYLVADMEIREAQKRKLDDVVFFDQMGNATEASTSNIFAVLDDKTILTPKISSMVLDGITRKKLIEFLRREGLSLIEADISKSELESSREIWLTNAIQGIRLVDQYEKISFIKEKNLYQNVCLKFGRFGEKYHE